MGLIQDLEATRDETLKHFTLGEQDLARTYAPGKWSIKFILHHLADSETVLYDRIRRVLSEPRQVLWVFDQDAWAKGLNYSEVPLPRRLRVGPECDHLPRGPALREKWTFGVCAQRDGSADVEG